MKNFKNSSCGYFFKNFIMTINSVIKNNKIIRCRLLSTSDKKMNYLKSYPNVDRNPDTVPSAYKLTMSPRCKKLADPSISPIFIY